MKTLHLTGVVIGVMGAVLAMAPFAGAQAELDHGQVINRYCAGCHNDRTRNGNLSLEELSLDEVGGDAAVWEKVVRKLRTRTMPPAGRPRPDDTSYDALASFLETSIDRAAAVAPNPGRPSIHRLNRTEYANAVRDILSLEIDERALLPADDTDVHGFDNNAEVLTISPALFERYLSTSRKIARRALGQSTGRTVETYRLPKLLVHDDRMSEALPFGSSGGAAIQHYFPVDGEYRLVVRLSRNNYNYIHGLSEPRELEVRLNRALLKVFTVGRRDLSAAAEGWAGTLDGPAEWEQYGRAADTDFNVRFDAKAGLQSLGVSFVRKTWEPDGVLQPRPVGWTDDNDEHFDGHPGVDTVTIEGPFTTGGPGETASRSRILTCQPTSDDDESCARTILSTLARRAYRRTATTEDVDTLMEFYRRGHDKGDFETGIEVALVRLLVSPDFLFRVERDPVDAPRGSVHRLTDVELASRLSFFLWSSVPDDELLDVAIRGQLSDPAVLDQQVRRMIADARSSVLVNDFVDQWLQVRNIRDVRPNVELFPEFDENLRASFQRETELFVESQLREDRSVVDLLSADYTFVDERLARHYGMSGVYGDRFRRVSLADSPRGGLLGHGSLLTVTSYSDRTSPVVRGKWLLDTILSAPPPEPPPDVPGLPSRGEDGKHASVRMRLETHRANPVCAACHAQLDPMGFALENFDAVGTYRTHDGGVPVDASGRLPGGQEFRGLDGLRALLVGERREQFVHAFTEKLAGYALGRTIEYYDLPTVRQIVRESGTDDFSWSSIILGIVKSTPFQMRRTES
jgi:hypothetical protein